MPQTETKNADSALYIQAHSVDAAKNNMYEALYEAYDRIVLREAEEKKKLARRSMLVSSAEEVRRKHLLLDRKRQRLSELPAFSSMRQISEAEEAILGAHPQQQQLDEEDKEEDKPKMDGFERMRQCRFLLNPF